MAASLEPHRGDMIWSVVQVALGGAVGAVLRYLTGVGAVRLMGPALPWGTLTVNVLGSFLMGALFVFLAEKAGTRFSPLLMTGVLGGFTTFSAFSLDAVNLWERGEPGMAAAYVAASVGLSILALVGGLALGRGIWM